MKTPVVVLGASGQVGLFSIARLLESGRPVIAIRREPYTELQNSIEGLEIRDWDGACELVGAGLNGGSRNYALLSCGPIRLALQLLTRTSSGSAIPWERVVVTGTTSVHTKASSKDAQEVALVEEISATRAKIAEFCSQHSLPLSVLSPTLIYGCGMDQNLTSVYRWIRKYGFAPIARQAGGLRQPLHVDDLARTLSNAVTKSPAPDLDSPVCGAGSIPYKEMIERVFIAAQKKRRLLRLPDSLVPMAIAIYRILAGKGQLSREMFRRQSQDMAFDDTQARETLGHIPRPFDPGPEDFGLPDSIRRIQDAL